MAYFEIYYYLHDETNQWMVYKVNQEEAKVMTKSWRCVLVDPKTMEKFETPQEWLTVVEEKAPQEKISDEWIQTLEELQKLYVETFWKELSIRYKNDIEWIKSKLYS